MRSVGKQAALCLGLSARYAQNCTNLSFTKPSPDPSHRVLFQDGEIVFVRLDRYDIGPRSECEASKHPNMSADIQPHVNARDFEATGRRTSLVICLSLDGHERRAHICSRPNLRG